jgi:hypothetical protein
MDLTNLGPMLVRVFAAVRRVIGPPTKHARERKAIITRTRRNGSSVSAGIEAEMAKAKERAKEKEKLKEAGIGRAMA